MTAECESLRDELRRTGDEIDSAQRRLTEIADGRWALEADPISEQTVIDALAHLDPVWDELFPAEQERIVQLLVETVEVRPEGLEIRLRGDGLRSLVAELEPAEEEVTR